MHIAVDLDDVVLDFCGGLREAIRKEYNFDVGDFEKWELRDVLDPVVGRNWWSWLRERDWLWPNFPAIDGAIGGIDALRRDGHYVELVTSKPEWAEYAVWKWLGKWRPPFNAVTIVGPKDRKVDFTDARILIDDKFENCDEFAKAGRTGLLFDRPHNRDAETELGDPSPWTVTRVFAWPSPVHVVRFLQEVYA